MKAKPGEPRAFVERALETNTDKCLLWPFYKNTKGYGRLRYEGRTWLAHRLVLVRASGEEPDGYESAHFCRTPSCVNPNHLRWATAQENTDDKFRHGTVLEGANAANARLTETQVLAIFQSTESGPCLAERFGVGTSTIDAIRTGTSWRSTTRHLSGPTRCGPAHGTRSGTAKLSEANVLHIFESNESRQQLAERFGVSVSSIAHIQQGRSWRSVTGAAA